MNNRCAGLVAVLFSFFAFGLANADIEFAGVLNPMLLLTRIDSVEFSPPDTTFLTPDWVSENGRLDTFTFTGVIEWPQTLVLHGANGPWRIYHAITYPRPDSWYDIGFGLHDPLVLFYGDYGGVEESEPMVERLPRLIVSPSVVTGQMSVRLQPAATGRPVVEIHDAVGNVVRSLDCTAGADGMATATWNREDEYGRLVPEGVYFCRYAGADAIAVRKVLVAR